MDKPMQLSRLMSASFIVVLCGLAFVILSTAAVGAYVLGSIFVGLAIAIAYLQGRLDGTENSNSIWRRHL